MNQAAATNKIRNFMQVIKLMHSHNIHIPLPTMKTNIQIRFTFQAATNHLIACMLQDLNQQISCKTEMAGLYHKGNAVRHHPRNVIYPFNNNGLQEDGAQ